MPDANMWSPLVSEPDRVTPQRLPTSIPDMGTPPRPEWPLSPAELQERIKSAAAELAETGHSVFSTYAMRVEAELSRTNGRESVLYIRALRYDGMSGRRSRTRVPGALALTTTERKLLSLGIDP